MLRSTIVVLFMGLKNLLFSVFFNRGSISCSDGQKMEGRSCAIKINTSDLFKQQGVCLYSCVWRILVPAKINLQSILPDNIKFKAFNEMLIPV
ncbi:hypothetical protein D3C87_427370 [compost metagenome]